MDKGIDYSKTIIYKIYCNDPTITDIYIGHTTNFTQRKKTHKQMTLHNTNIHSNRYVYNFIRDHGGWDNWSMVQLQESNLKNKREAEAYEHNWIQKLGATLNSKKPYMQCKENSVEYKKEWYENNKKEVLEKAKNNYENNKEQKLAYQKKYAAENKEKISAANKIYNEKNKEIISEKKKIYRVKNQEYFNSYLKEWQETNKEKIKQRRSEIINCECGNAFTYGNKVRHARSKLHQNYLNTLCVPIGEECLVNDENDNESDNENESENDNDNDNEINSDNHEELNEEEPNKKPITEEQRIYKQKYNLEHKEEIKVKCKKYYEEHKEEIKNNVKKYTAENIDAIKEYKKNHYLKNKQKILERQNQEFTCECGSTIKYGGKAEHMRSVKHKTYIEGMQNSSLTSQSI